MQSLNAVMMMFQTGQRHIQPEHLVDLGHSLTRLVDCLFPIQGDFADFAGTAPLPGGHYVHPIKTAEVATLAGRSLGMPRSKLLQLANSAALMNLGYLALKQSLMDEPRRLMGSEWEGQVHEHPPLSVEALTSSGLAEEAIAAIGQHHERWDGSGYPAGLRGEAIGIEARILGLADSFVSLRSQRPYRAPVSAEAALGILAEGSGVLYEPTLFDAFAETIRAYGQPEARAGAGMAAASRPAAEEAEGNGARQHGPADNEQHGTAGRDALLEDDEERQAASRRAEAAFAATRIAEPATRPVVQRVSAVASARQPAALARSRVVAIRLARQSRASARRRRTLFSAEVYLDGARGRWLG